MLEHPLPGEVIWRDDIGVTCRRWNWRQVFSTAEWREWLATTDRFGTLVVTNTDLSRAPVAVPTHFTMSSDDVLVLHLARPDPIWSHLESAAEVRLSAIGDYAYVPRFWRAKNGAPEDEGVPTSYYTAVQFVCRPTIIDDPQGRPASSLPNSPTSSPRGYTAPPPPTIRPTAE